MDGNLLFLAEVLLSLGAVMGFAIWQLRSLRRLKEEKEAKRRREAAEGAEDSARSEPRG